MDLNALRDQINQIDRQMVGLFKNRMQISADIAQYKTEHNLPIHNKAREREVLFSISEMAGNDLEGYARVLYATLFDLSRSYQARKTYISSELTDRIHKALDTTPKLFPQKGSVACQGIEGAYSQLACEKLFALPNITFFKTFEGVFQAVESGLCEFGVLPIENSSYGSVNGVYDLMHRHHFHIVKSIRLHIDHHLLAKPGTKLSEIREIISHEQALGQCSKFLSSIPNLKVTVAKNTAEAAELVASSDRNDLAAISSQSCIELYRLQLLSDDVQNTENNYTRFICIAKDLLIYPGSDKMSLMFTLSHQPGALYQMIAKFAALGVNLTKLESRPIPGSDFEFLFYFDLEASGYSNDILFLLSELSQTNQLFTFLGCYSEI